MGGISCASSWRCAPEFLFNFFKEERHCYENINSPQIFLQMQLKPNQNSRRFLVKIDKVILKIHMEMSRTKNNKNNLQKKRVGGFILSYSLKEVTKSVWYQCPER